MNTCNQIRAKMRPRPQCLKIALKLAFNIANKACYVYILSGQKFIKNAKKMFCVLKWTRVSFFKNMVLVVVLANRWRFMCKCIDLNGKDICGLTQFMKA